MSVACSVHLQALDSEGAVHFPNIKPDYRAAEWAKTRNRAAKKQLREAESRCEHVPVNVPRPLPAWPLGFIPLIVDRSSKNMTPPLRVLSTVKGRDQATFIALYERQCFFGRHLTRCSGVTPLFGQIPASIQAS
jgi:hypothetical protein